jgi:ParB family chromosome partitioning protein
VNPTVVKQRLKLAAVSDKLLDVYAEEVMTLEQLMAFTVTNDHARQEKVWESLARAYNKEPYYIRRQLTEGAVRAADKRARFVGVDTYEAAGGVVLRDLFQHDDGGWLQDPALLDRLVIEKLQAEAETLRAEGWKWIAVAPDFPYGHTAGLRRLSGETVDLTDEERASHDALKAEYDRLEEEYAQADELPDEVDQRLGEIETALATFEARAVVYDPTEIARAGVFVSIDADGDLRIERGYVRPEDEAPAEPVEGSDGDAPADFSEPEPEGDEGDGLKPLSERLITELTAHRTLALRDGWLTTPAPRSWQCCTRSVSAHSIVCRQPLASRSRPRARPSMPRRRDSPTAPQPRQSRPAISNGRISCQRPRTISGTRWWRSIATARQLCSHIALRSASTPCMSRGAAARGASLTPTGWPAR